ncbi:DUF4148 domain-containing protein [Achromobacter animicus]|uniref:DUF4148 domain-containing protein n=1 Tax=Achromobacter animicus TaxID=1389935 RepID=UPI0024497426|nr:DUF4148 domain-containing protein [Achromobacter animicus]MDH0682745.1 DUF4148 domain-containing protein [Achromobacter animicus]
MMKVTQKVFAALLVSALAPVAYGQSTVSGASSTAPREGLTRAEVQADLAVWKRAGMDKFWRGEHTPDIYSREYRSAHAEYVRMKNGEEYRQELNRRQ